MSSDYDPRAYWEGRLKAHGGLRGTGHISFTEGYNAWLYKAKQRTLAHALSGTRLNGLSVLDVGCGNGYFVGWYTDRGARVDGIDISATSVEALQSRHRGSFRVVDIAAGEDPGPGSYDIVNVWDVMYHVVDEGGFARALRFVAKGVRPGGLLLLTDVLGAARDLQVAPHVRTRCLRTYQDFLSALGFEMAGHHFLFRWLNRYVSHPAIDSRLGRLYYWLDGREFAIPTDSVSLGVWRRMASS